MGTSRRHLVVTVILAMVASAPAATGQASDLAIGTWELNVAKSSYDPGPAPKSGTRTIAPAPNGYKFTSDGVNAAGTLVHLEFTAAFDGKYHVLTGSPGSDSIMIKRVDAYIVESIQKKGAREVVHLTRVVSKDGRTMTNTATGTTAQGTPFTNVEVFDKK